MPTLVELLRFLDSLFKVLLGGIYPLSNAGRKCAQLWWEDTRVF